MKSISMKTTTAIFGMILLTTLPLSAQKGTGDVTGLGREIEKPAIVKIEGILDYIKTGPCENTTGRAYIGTHLFLKTENEDSLINIHLGAAMAVETFVNNLEPGQTVEVLAFRTEKMKPNEFIAKEVTANKNRLQLRDDNLRPFWAGDRGYRNRQGG